MTSTIWIRVKQHDGFVIFRTEDVHSIEPVLGKTLSVKCYYLALKTSARIIRISIEQAEHLSTILTPVDLSEEPSTRIKLCPRNI
jgi:hypothetical protein